MRLFRRVPPSELKAVQTLPQLRQFFTNLRGYHGLIECRPGYAADAEWSELDVEARLWRHPAAKMKAGRDHVSPLSYQTLALLERFA